MSWETHRGTTIVATTVRYIAFELAKKNRVLFVNPPLPRSLQLFKRGSQEAIKFRKILNGKEDDLQPVKDNLWVLYPKTVKESINWISNPILND